MNKDIRFSGLSLAPSPYDAPDGTLDQSLGLIHEDGALRPVFPPKTVGTLPSGARLLYIHTLSDGSRNYILAQGDTLRYSTSPDFATTTEIGIPSPQAITAVGHTLAVMTASGLHYALWKGGSYKALGQQPPRVPISFGMLKKNTTYAGYDSWYRDYSSLYADTRFQRFLDPADDVHQNPRETELQGAAFARMTQHVFAVLLRHVNDNILSKGMFYQPFFLRFAYRLFDGSYAYHSEPILMTPQTLPIVKATHGKDGDNDESHWISASVDSVAMCSLVYMMNGIPSGLRDWSDIISSLDIFVSAPVYTFDQSSVVRGIVTAGELFRRMSGSANPPSGILHGHYADDTDSDFKSRYVLTSNSTPVFDLPLNADFLKDLAACSIFYRLGSFSIDQLMVNYVSPRPVPLDDDDLSALQTRSVLPDDYQSRHSIHAACLHTYNSRLHLANLTLTPPVPTQLPYLVQRTTVSSLNFTKASLSVALSSDWQSAYIPGDEANVKDLSLHFPRFLYYPDPKASALDIRQGDSSWRVPLRPHENLNGACWVSPDFFFTAPNRQLKAAPQPPAGTPSSFTQPSSLYLSLPSNPFVFPVTSMTSVGSGAVLALSSAARALSQGQFGQFPLYAFTDEGVWALEVSSSGTYSARQPITRDVLLSPLALAQMDSSVIFATVRGLMLLSGSQATCISTAVDSDTPFDGSSLPGLAALLPPGYHLRTLRQFLSSARIAYDYPGQRIIVFSPTPTYAYVYSIRSASWATVTSAGLYYPVNSYPDALAVTLDRRLVNLSVPDTSAPVRALAISRPLKLDAPGVLKAVDALIIRGDFPAGAVSAALYGSRDLSSWFPVTSSASHRLRGFRGSPYRYFRLALLASLAPGQSISAASISFIPRFTNRLR